MRKTVVAALVFLAGGFLAWSLLGGLFDSSRKPDLREVTNRIWVDKVSKGPRDLVFRIGLFSKLKQQAGVASQSSSWRIFAERVRFKVDAKQVELEFPQDGRKVRFDARVWPCKGEAPAPFDLCLELKHGRQSFKLYSERSATFSESEAENMMALVGLANESEPVSCSHCSEGLPHWLDATSSDAP